MLFLSMVMASVTGQPLAGQVDFQRPVDAAPQEKSIGGGYVVPKVQRPLPRSYWRQWGDVAVLAAGMAIAAWLVHARRSRTGLVLLAAGSVGYMGFYREGCVCPIGSIQNVSLALADSSVAPSLLVIAIFVLPLAFTLLFGRVFCSGVCALGAIQELVALRPIQVPKRIDRALGWLRYVYLLLAIWYAIKPLAEREFLICRFDPFVGFFRLTGTAGMLSAGGAILLLGVFVGRPYCRYLCPYGAILSLLSRIAQRNVSITPDKELDCGLCTKACPYGAIEEMRAIRSECVACARCYTSCPRQRVRDTGLPGVAPSSNVARAST